MWVWVLGWPLTISVSLDKVTYFLVISVFWLVEDNKEYNIPINFIEV